MKPSRTQLFFQAFAIIMRSGPMWLVALAVAVVSLVFSLLIDSFLPADSVFSSILLAIFSAATGAFLTGALIVLANNAAEGRFATFGEGFAAGARFYPTLLLVDLILAVPVFFVDLAANAYLSQIQSDISASSLTTSVAALSLLVCLLTPFLLAVLLVAEGIVICAERSVALEANSAWAAFRRGWGLFTKKLGDLFVIGLIMLGISIVTSILFGCAGFFIAVGANAGAMNSTASIPNFASSTPFTIALALVMIPFQLWFSVVWTLAFRRWQAKDLPQAQGAVIPPANFPPRA